MEQLEILDVQHGNKVLKTFTGETVTELFCNIAKDKDKSDKISQYTGLINFGNIIARAIKNYSEEPEADISFFKDNNIQIILAIQDIEFYNRLEDFMDMPDEDSMLAERVQMLFDDNQKLAETILRYAPTSCPMLKYTEINSDKKLKTTYQYCI